MTTPRKHSRHSSNSILRVPNTAALPEHFILKETGIPAVFAETLKTISKEKNIAFAIRGGLPFQRYMMPCMPKPVTVKAKTGNWGFTKGVIAEDPALGKLENNGGSWVIKPRNDKKELPQEPGSIQTMLHKLSLREIMGELETGEFLLAGIENDRLIITSQIAPENSPIQFCIDLAEKSPRMERQRDLEKIAKATANLPETLEPDWWDAQKWGEFERALDNYYPAQMRDSSQTTEFSDIKIFGIPVADKILPITGDQDLLWISRPAQSAEDLQKFATVSNTFKISEIERLVSERIKLALHLARNSHEKLPELLQINNASIARLGCVTTFESYIIDEVNKSLNQVMTHMRDLFQHGTENRNPGMPSPMDAPMVHVWRGRVSLTQDDDELIEFVMQKDYLEENIIDIHPQWDMNKWAPVVKRQLELGQPVPAATLKVLDDYLALQKIDSTARVAKQLGSGIAAVIIDEPKTPARLTVPVVQPRRKSVKFNNDDKPEPPISPRRRTR